MHKPTITTRNNNVFEMEDGKLYALSHDNIVTTIGKHELSLDNRLLNDKIQELYAEITELKAENKKLDEKNASLCTSVLEGLFAQLDLAVQSKNLTHAQNVASLMEQLLNIETKLKCVIA